MRRTLCATIIGGVLSALPLAAQDAFRRTARVVYPVELSGPPKKPPVISPAMRALQNTSVMKVDPKDANAIAAAVRELTSLIQQFRNEPDLYFIRATLACQNNGNRESILNDIVTSLNAHTSGGTYIYDSVADKLVLKSKVEFDLGRYQDAMSDVDAALHGEYMGAENLFNDGNVKPNQPTPPCVWRQQDFEKLEQQFPKDYRPLVYLGLYLLQFSHYSLDFDYQPVLKLFEHAGELNPSSPVPPYLSAGPHIAGGIGGMISKGSSTCIDDVVPRTKACLALDELHRTGVRLLTKAIAADQTFAPAYELRATALFQLRQSRQAIRDYNKVLELNQKANVFNDRALAKMDLHDYQGAILDYSKAIEQGCEKSLCPSYENRANAYLKIHDYLHAINDVSHAIRNFLADTIFGLNVEQFRRIYPEYDDVADDALCEKLRVLFNPQMVRAVYCNQFLVDAKEVDDFVLPELLLKRGDAYAALGDMVKANREYDRVSLGYPSWAEHTFTFRNGKRVRVHD